MGRRSYLTYIKTEEGWLYFSVIMDLYNRKIIGWALRPDMTTGNTTVRAFKMAVANRATTDEMLFHSFKSLKTEMLFRNNTLKESKRQWLYLNI